MKTTIQGGYRIYNHRHFPNILHAKFVKLKKETGKTIEFLIVSYLELALEVGGRTKVGMRGEIKPQEIISTLNNDSTWELAQSLNHTKPMISEDLCMPYGIISLNEE